MRLLSEHGRTPFAAGRSEREDDWIARKCAWGPDGGHWMSAHDSMLALYGARVSHGICRKCKARLEEESNA